MKAVAYIRVSTTEQVDTYSLDAQEREVRKLCEQRKFEFLHTYRDEGISAHSDRIEKRPGLSRLMADAKQGRFDVVIVHTFDRWARNLGVALRTIRLLEDAKVGFMSVAESIDYATGQGRLNLHILASFAEFHSDTLAVHVRKSRLERYERGMHNGAPPFGYEHCACVGRPKAHESSCRGPRLVENEAAALREVALRYAGGLVTLAEAAFSLNQQGFRTRQGNTFSAASVRFLLQNPFLVGRVRHRDPATRQWEEKQGRHEPLLTLSVFNQVQDRKARRMPPTLPSRRPYLLRGIGSCVHCGSMLWSEPLKSGHTYYREPRGKYKYGVDDCPAAGKSVRCSVLDPQVAELFRSLKLPMNWRQEVERRVRGFANARGVEQKKTLLVERIRRLTNVYRLGNIDDDEFRQTDKDLKQQLASLRVPELDDALDAGELLLDFERLWQRATLGERNRLLNTIVSRIEVDLLTGRLVGLTPRPAFWSVCEAVRVDNPRVLLFKPEEVKRRLAEQQAADLVVVETGEN